MKYYINLKNKKIYKEEGDRFYVRDSNYYRGWYTTVGGSLEGYLKFFSKSRNWKLKDFKEITLEEAEKYTLIEKLKQ